MEKCDDGSFNQEFFLYEYDVEWFNKESSARKMSIYCDKIFHLKLLWFQHWKAASIPFTRISINMYEALSIKCQLILSCSHHDGAQPRFNVFILLQRERKRKVKKRTTPNEPSNNLHRALFYKLSIHFASNHLFIQFICLASLVHAVVTSFHFLCSKEPYWVDQ